MRKLHQLHCRLLDFNGDLRRVKQRVVNQAVVDGALDSFAMLRREIQRSFDFNAEIVEARGVFGLISNNPDACAFGCQLVIAQILRGIESGAGGE